MTMEQMGTWEGKAAVSLEKAGATRGGEGWRPQKARVQTVAAAAGDSSSMRVVQCNKKFAFENPVVFQGAGAAHDVDVQEV